MSRSRTAMELEARKTVSRTEGPDEKDRQSW